MSHYRPYPAYKDSGVEWIGPVPEHWETLRIKRAAQLRNERRNDSPSGWTYVGLEDVEPESGKYEPTVGASRQSEDSMVGVFRAGDVLYGKLRPYLRKAIVAEQDGVCSTEFLVLSEGRGKSPWLHRWLLTQEVTQQIEAGCDGAKMPRADWEHVGSIPMPLPPAAEQTAIAAALDRETARIDALIAKKTRFIELLKEKRQALITHAVTKGLDPTVKMKDSGVEWIGEVPSHWEVARVKHVSRQESGHTPDKKNPDFWEDCQIPWVSLKDSDTLRNVDHIHDTDTYINERGLAGSSARMLPKGTVVFTRDATVGLCAITARPMAVSQHVIGWVPTGKLDPEFLLRVFEAMATWLESLTAGATIKTIGMDDVGILTTPYPPMLEQIRIATYIRTVKASMARLIELTEHSITLLKERRSALITAAVTGQIDLRPSAANQP